METAEGVSGGGRAALRILQAGAIVAVVAAAPYKLFDLDRFFVPKELSLAVTATLAALFCIWKARSMPLTRVDKLLAASLGLTCVSALFATNVWLAERSLAVVLASVGCLWVARALSRRGHSRALVAGLALAGVLAAITSLLQAYGVRTELFSLNRAPGGTLGNRNFVAHLCAITFPAVLFAGIRAPSASAFARWCAGGAVLSAALILSRSRAAWLALLAGVVVLLVTAAIALRANNGKVKPMRAVAFLCISVLGGGAALVVPNTLDWKSDNPYMETAQGLVNYKGGSGHGRLIQYRHSLEMSLRHPLLGVGPGNWPVVYPKFAPSTDPSLGQDGMTSNPWPSSDWVAAIAERGPAAALLMLGALLLIFLSSIHGVFKAADSEMRLAAAVAASTLVVVVIVGAFDAVLLLPAPAMISWALIGALAPADRMRTTISINAGRRVLVVILLFTVGALAAARSAGQLIAMSIVSEGARPATWERASHFDPGSYRIRVRLADQYERRGDCKRAKPHARMAKELFPSSPNAKRLASACGL